ncbi:MAG: outer membrane protein assembly factor BamA [Ignavibacteriales bacterium]|nr:outer membrane protein assembly factor BamA [Ignavibacteriales bacterium]
MQKITALLITSLCLITLNGNSIAQRSKPEQYNILGISVEGNTKETGTESSAIIGNSGLKVGDEISIPGDEIRQAIQKLWALRIFSDVQILIENKIDKGVYLLIRVKEYKRLGKLEYIGLDDVSEDDIKKKVTLTTGQILSPYDIQHAISIIKSIYEEEGHLLAAVVPEQIDEDSVKSNKVMLRFRVDEGPRLTIKEISFSGNNAFNNGDLKSEFEDTEEKKWYHFILPSPKFERKKYEEDKRRLIKFYKKNGYIDAEILGDSIWYSEDKKKILLHINLNEGQQYKVRNITWEGNTVYSSEVLTERLGFSKGMIFDEDKFEKNLRGNEDQTDVGSLYLDDGYLRFNLDPSVQRIGIDSVDLKTQIFERNQFRIGQVDIRGNRKTRENVIRRELFTRPGDFFSRALIIRSLRQLSQLNYFNPEKLRPDTRLVDDQTVDLIYEVEEKSNDNVNASVGYSGAFGVTGALGFTINNFAISNPLEGGGGQVLNFDWQFGEGARFRTFSLGFTEPWLFDRPTTLGFSIFDTRQKFSWDLRQTGVSARLGRRLNWPDNYSRADWTLRYQNNDIRDAGGSPYYDLGVSQQVSLTQVLSRNSTDSPIFPSIGSNVALSTEISGGPLPGTVDYHKWIFNSDWYIPVFGSSRVVLSLSSAVGYLEGFKKDSKIPPIEYFYMGGTLMGYVSTTPLRGYEDRSVGPLTALGQEEGGRVMSKHSLELRFAATINPMPIYFLTFVEGGNVFRNLKEADFFDLKRSYGIGARLLIQPIGMIGFDYAYGADDVLPKDGKPDGWHFHFQFGRGF